MATQMLEFSVFIADSTLQTGGETMNEDNHFESFSI